MKYSEIKGMSDEALATLVQEQRATLRDERMKAAGAGTRDVKTVRTAKTTIAQALTELSARRHGVSATN